ncbi:small nucleolar ribonucleoprotein-like protein complex subunit [Lojkania enalia]|uniref:Small nucleolar ribonucleoprotein-like protein complex subunit n=1 Tax=Lojkania enalia TaxID=147567 RepID=A0A9P4KCF4_9PLEO|nr:small nucleolar ribonucleoprotein-like protein complex subunit [Didymosphaeria enalia]
MSSFFTSPASQRKRKRTESSVLASKKRNVASSTSQTPKSFRRKEREESITGSESSGDEGEDVLSEGHEGSGDSSGGEGETAAERRLKLAEQYLENIRNEVQDDYGFDAAEIDRDLIAERLKEDVAETKGRVYRRIADNLDFEAAVHAFGKSKLQHSVTGCAIRLPYAWTISKDLVVEKWVIADPKMYNTHNPHRPTNITPRRTPKKLFWRKGNIHKSKDKNFLGHTGAILSIAVSDSGRFLATGDKNARLIIWDADTLTPRKLFVQHRDAITSLAFRRGTEQLFSASADRTIKIWSASELAYVETLFGHQDTIVGIAGGLDPNQETCISVGARDRTARLWKVVEESQLVFRGGGTAKQKSIEKLRKSRFGGKVDDDAETMGQPNGVHEEEDPPIAYAEGSIDCVALLDAGLFVTGSDNGTLSLWSVNKKKPLFTIPLAHGRDPPLPPEAISANKDAVETGIRGPRLPRYITALTTVPFADLILTGSWDGWIRAWRIGPEKRTIEALGKVGRSTPTAEDVLIDDSEQFLIHPNEINRDAILIRGIINSLAVYERGDRGKDGLCVVAAVGKEHRLGRWMSANVQNGIVVFEVPRKMIANEAEDALEEEEDE